MFKLHAFQEVDCFKPFHHVFCTLVPRVRYSEQDMKLWRISVATMPVGDTRKIGLVGLRWGKLEAGDDAVG